MNAAIAFDFFLGKGLKDFQAAAIIGNLEQESGLDPTVREIGGGPGIGIAQWSKNARWKDLLLFAERTNSDPWTLDTQLEFLWHELETNNGFGLAELRASTTLESATVVFQDRFERCGVCATNDRIRFARSALYACPGIRVPPRKKKGVLSAAFGMISIIAVAGYGAYKVVRGK